LDEIRNAVNDNKKMPLFSKQRLTEAEAFEKRLNVNPYFPFSKRTENVFVYKTRYWRFYTALVIAALCVGVMLVCIRLNVVFQFYFVFALGILIISLGTAYTYKDLRTYVLDGNSNCYNFYIANKVVTTGDFHNIYIRLRKRFDSGRTYYYLIFNGFRIDKQVLTGTCTKADSMRKLGQQLAQNLGINYFDETNVSHHHVVRHKRNTARDAG